MFYLYLDELIALLENRFSEDLRHLIDSRKRAHTLYEKMTPPRVMTSEGEVITGVRSDVEAPKGALIGTPVSAGVAEGYVKVVLIPEDAKLSKGDILVAPFIDPGWTPLFYSILVTPDTIYPPKQQAIGKMSESCKINLCLYTSFNESSFRSSNIL